MIYNLKVNRTGNIGYPSPTSASEKYVPVELTGKKNTNEHAELTIEEPYKKMEGNLSLLFMSFHTSMGEH